MWTLSMDFLLSITVFPEGKAVLVPFDEEPRKLSPTGLSFHLQYAPGPGRCQVVMSGGKPALTKAPAPEYSEEERPAKPV